VFRSFFGRALPRWLARSQSARFEVRNRCFAEHRA
jgi:hypothetical protein